MNISHQIQALDISPAIASLSLTKQEAAAVQSVCAKIKSALALEQAAHPDNLRKKLHEAELAFNDSGTEESLVAYQDAARQLAGATEGFAGIQRVTSSRNNSAVDEIKGICLRIFDDLEDKVRKSATRVREAEQAVRDAFSDLSLEQAFEQRLERTLELQAIDRRRVEHDHAALHFLVIFGLAANPWAAA
jgi:hypothetical protein